MNDLYYLNLVLFDFVIGILNLLFWIVGEKDSVNVMDWIVFDKYIVVG